MRGIETECLDFEGVVNMSSAVDCARVSTDVSVYAQEWTDERGDVAAL